MNDKKYQTIVIEYEGDTPPLTGFGVPVLGCEVTAIALGDLEANTSSITLTARQIGELARMHGFEINVDDYDDDELDESEYTIIPCPPKGILDEETGKVYHTKYCAYAEATYGDGECEPLTDPI